MSKNHVLKASYSEYTRYYKRLKLGLQKACFFLRDLEPELEKLAQKNATEHRYYNPDTDKEYFFLEKDIFLIRMKIDALVLEYLIMKPELLMLDEYDEFNKMIVKGILFNFELENHPKLNMLLSQRSDDETKKLDILARLFFYARFLVTLHVSYDTFVTTYGMGIIEFCVTQCKNADVSKILSSFNVKSVEQLSTDKNIHRLIAKPVLDHYLSNFPKNFFLKDNKLAKDCIAPDAYDFSMDFLLPRVFSSDKNNRYCIDSKKFFFFLQDLDDYRIHLEEKKLNEKVLKVKSMKQFEQMCIRFRTPEAYEKVKWYSCNFLSKKLLTVQELDLNDRFSTYIWDVTIMLMDIYLERLNLHTKLFSFFVINCFSSYEYNGEFFYGFPNKFNFIKKIKNGGIVKK